MITCTVTESGALLVTACNETRQFIADELRRGACYWSVMAELFESYSCNGSYTPFDAGQGNPFVGLTSAPCIAEEMYTSDSGDYEIVGRFWFSADYMLINELEALRDRGRFVFSLGGAA